MSAAPATVGVVLADLSVGGLQVMAVRLALALDRREFAPRFYTFDAGGPLEGDLRAASVPHRHLPRGAGADPGHARRLAAVLAQDAVRLVHCHNITALFHGARAASRARRLPVLYTEHDRDMPAPWRHRLLHRWLAARTNRTVAVSRRLADALVRWEGFPRDRTSALLNGTDDPLAAWSGTREAARAELGWDDSPVVLAVGSLTPVKNHALLVATLPRLRERVPGARVVIAGEGPLQGELRAAASALPAGAFELLGTRRDVARLLAAADVFALPSHSEGLSLSLVEAHGAGRPSVAFDVGGNREVIVDGRTGRLVPEGDADGFVDALADCLADGGVRHAAGEAARARYLAEFTHARMVAAYATLYRELLGKGGR